MAAPGLRRAAQAAHHAHRLRLLRRHRAAHAAAARRRLRDQRHHVRAGPRGCLQRRRASRRILLLILGIVATTGEYRHRTITGSLLATPDRRRFLASKLHRLRRHGRAAGHWWRSRWRWPSASPGWRCATSRPTCSRPATTCVLALRGIAAAALSGAIGVAIGAIVRNQVAAVVGILIYLFVAEPVVGRDLRGRRWTTRSARASRHWLAAAGSDGTAGARLGRARIRRLGAAAGASSALRSSSVAT